jgi:hypothetical protein
MCSRVCVLFIVTQFSNLFTAQEGFMGFTGVAMGFKGVAMGFTGAACGAVGDRLRHIHSCIPKGGGSGGRARERERKKERGKEREKESKRG